MHDEKNWSTLLKSEKSSEEIVREARNLVLYLL